VTTAFNIRQEFGQDPRGMTSAELKDLYRYGGVPEGDGWKLELLRDMLVGLSKNVQVGFARLTRVFCHCVRSGKPKIPKEFWDMIPSISTFHYRFGRKYKGFSKFTKEKYFEVFFKFSFLNNFLSKLD
jgi:hypothetical protein